MDFFWNFFDFLHSLHFSYENFRNFDAIDIFRLNWHFTRGSFSHRKFSQRCLFSVNFPRYIWKSYLNIFPSSLTPNLQHFFKTMNYFWAMLDFSSRKSLSIQRLFKTNNDDIFPFLSEKTIFSHFYKKKHIFSFKKRHCSISIK